MSWKNKLLTTFATINGLRSRNLGCHVRNMLMLIVKKGKNEESWKKLLPKLTTIFPKLKELWYSNEGDLGPITKKRILELCNTNHWALNHSLAGL